MRPLTHFTQQSSTYASCMQCLLQRLQVTVCCVLHDVQVVAEQRAESIFLCDIQDIIILYKLSRCNTAHNSVL